MSEGGSSEGSVGLLAKEAERASKKQRASISAELHVIDAAVAALECGDIASLDNAAKPSSAAGSAATRADKELTSALATRLLRAVDSASSADGSEPLPSLPELAQPSLNPLAVQHLHRSGCSSAAQQLSSFLGCSDCPEPFSSLLSLRSEIASGFVDNALQLNASLHHSLGNSSRFPLLSDADDHRERAHTDFELRRLQFLSTLQLHGKAEALTFARSELSRFADEFPAPLQELMGALVYGCNSSSSPYSHLHELHVNTAAADSYVQRQLRRLGHSTVSPLLCLVNAGGIALPRLSKLASICGLSSQSTDQLPIELDLGNEFCFRSVFTCPVARDQAGSENPPMLLPCGLVLGRQSIARLCGGSSKFRCPYCPQEMPVSQCQRIFL